MILGLDHLQVSIPAGRLMEALQFYVGMLGFTQVPKPREFAAHGGAWLVQGSVNFHLGEEREFTTDGRAHPAFLVDDLDATLQPIVGSGARHRLDEGPAGFRRASVYDPFGNRVEFMQKIN